MTPIPATLLVRGIGSLATSAGMVDDACVVADGSGIVHAGPASGLPALAPRQGFRELDVGGAAVVPGFVDSHTHAVWMGSRAAEFEERAAGASYEEIAERGGGIRATVRATAAASIPELMAAARPRLRAMLLGGTTTVEIKSGYGLDLHAEMRMLEAARRLGEEPDLPDVVTTYLPLHATPGGDRREYLREVLVEGLPRAVEARARFVDAFCEVGAFTPAECGAVLRRGAELGLVAKLHAEQRTRSGGAALMAELRGASADHLEHAADADLRGLAAAGVAAVLLPGAALVLGGPRPPGRRALDAGATVALATDCNPGTCWAESMPLMVALGVLTAGLSPAEALAAATAGGAAALRLHDRGRIAPGYRCDLVILETSDWRDLAYHLGGGVVRSVVRAGAIVDVAGG